jgi:hypothetical protein
MGVKEVKLGFRIYCDCCNKEVEVQAWVPWWDLRVTMGGTGDRSQIIDGGQLPDLWEYYTSGGWGSTNYTKTQLLCPECVRKWRDESVLEQMARKVHEKEKGR